MSGLFLSVETSGPVGVAPPVQEQTRRSTVRMRGLSLRQRCSDLRGLQSHPTRREQVRLTLSFSKKQQKTLFICLLVRVWTIGSSLSREPRRLFKPLPLIVWCCTT